MGSGPLVLATTNRNQAGFFFFLVSLRLPIAAATPAPRSRIPLGSGTLVPPDEVDEIPPEVVDEIPPVDVEMPPLDDVVVVEPLLVEVDVVVDVDVELDELLLDLELLLDFELFVKEPLLLDLLQKMKHLLDFELLLQEYADASLGATAPTEVVAIATPITAAFVILMYCMLTPSLQIYPKHEETVSGLG